LSFLAAVVWAAAATEYVDRRRFLAASRQGGVVQSAGAAVRGGAGIGEGIDQSVAELNGNLDALDDF